VYHHHLNKEFKPASFLTVNKGKTFNAVVTDIGSDKVIEAYIKEQNVVIRVNNAYILTPISRTFQAKDLKLYTQRVILHQDVQLTICDYSQERDIFLCEIINNGKNFAHQLLMNGFAKLDIDTVCELDPSKIQALKEQQEIASANSLRI